jgi:hypothetical protein
MERAPPPPQKPQEGRQRQAQQMPTKQHAPLTKGGHSWLFRAAAVLRRARLTVDGWLYTNVLTNQKVVWGLVRATPI